MTQVNKSFAPQRNVVLFTLLAILGLVLMGCGPAQASKDEIEQAWQTSAHADTKSGAFTRWNDADPPQIPENCAKCHSTTGYHDFLGLDSSTPGTIDVPAPVGTTIECEACHNEATSHKDSAVMPSGVELAHLQHNANCMECHQGRQSTVSVSEATAGLDEDEVNEELGFLNIHNNAAGPTLYGTEAQGGYEYEDRQYAGRYEHVPEFDTCVECHNPHTLRINAQQCNACHVEAPDIARLQNIRMTKVDYDGDGDTVEGTAGEIQTMRERLLLAIRLYAAKTKDLDNIVYEDRNPYFLNEDGEAYTTWTPRLLRAAYNYQYVRKGKGDYAHNPAYTLQLLYDSLDDLGWDTAAMTRPAAH
jgi:hypothetical protein